MQKTLLGMGAAALILIISAWFQGGWALVNEGFQVSGKMLFQVIPLLLLAFTTAGLISVLVSEETVSRWLGQGSGWKGITLGALAGALIPGGPYVFFPLAATFLISGARIGTVVSFITAKNLWTVTRIPLEIALIGPKITLVRYVVTFVFPIILGIIANLLLSGYTEKILTGIKKLQKLD